MSTTQRSTRSSLAGSRRFGLRFKFVLLISSILSLLFAAIASYLLISARANLRNNLNQQAKAFASLAAQPLGDAYSTYQDAGALQIKRQVDNFIQLDPAVVNVAVVGLDGSIKFSYADHIKNDLIKADGATFKAVYHTSPSGNYSLIVVPYFDASGQHPFAIAYQFSDAAISSATQRQSLTIVIICLLGLGFFAALSYGLINRLFLSPLVRLSTSAALISSGRYDQTIRSTTNDEIGDVTTSVNEMADVLKADIKKLHELDEMKSEFLMISSHNLRTPLTTIRAATEMLHTDPKVAAPSQKIVTMISDSANKLQLLTEEMLLIASIETNQIDTALKPLLASEVLAPLSEKLKQQGADKGLVIDVSISIGSAMIGADIKQLSDALYNLLDNAVKFTAAGGKVALSASQAGESLQIVVADTGIGIKPTELSRLFTKFHRGTSTMEYQYEGEGIGLYFSKLILDRHHATINVQSKLGLGTTVTVTIPIAKA